jgi:PAS domain S-box-containing protein
MPTQHAEQKQSEEDLIKEQRFVDEVMQETEARFRAFTEDTPALAWMKDIHGVYVYLNKTFESFFRDRLGHWHGKTDADIFPETARQLIENDRKVLAENRSIQIVEETANPDGGRTTWLNIKFPFSTDSNRFVGGIGVDITERMRVTEVWRLLSAIVESSYDAIIGMTLDGIITSWNRAAEKLYGYSALEMVGKSIKILLPPEFPDDVSDILQRVANREDTYDYETVRRRNDGILVDVSLRVSPILDASEEVVGAATIVRDITKRKEAEEALLQCEKLAAAGRLAKSVAHEVNDPLEGALNAIHLARTRPDKAEEMLEVAERELRLVVHITRSVNERLATHH